MKKQIEKIYTIGELRKAIRQFNDSDIVVVEIHEGERGEDLYEFSIDTIDNLRLSNGTEVTEVRLCI
jgi:hypothetical protein